MLKSCKNETYKVDLMGLISIFEIIKAQNTKPCRLKSLHCN